jgi:hypothetical protein
MEYAIRAFDKKSGKILVEFIGYERLLIDLPLTSAGLYVSGSELDTYLKSYIPQSQVSRKSIIEQGVANEADIAALVKYVIDVVPDPGPLYDPTNQTPYTLRNEIKAVVQEVISELSQNTV